MRYRQRVAIQEPIEGRDEAGAVIPTWSTIAGLEEVAATIVPASNESRQQQMTPTTDQWRVILGGRYEGITTAMSVWDGARRFGIEGVELLVGRRQTVLAARIAQP